MAQALMSDPKVLILDEPTSGLDPNQITEIRNLIREIGQERTVLLSTHIMQEVEAMCNRVIIINKGELAADDTISNLQKRHHDENAIGCQFSRAQSKFLHFKRLKALRTLKTWETTDTASGPAKRSMHKNRCFVSLWMGTT